MVSDTTVPPAAAPAAVPQQAATPADSVAKQPTTAPVTGAAATPAAVTKPAAAKTAAQSPQTTTPAPAKPAAARRSDTAVAQSASGAASTTPKAVPTPAASTSASAGSQGADSLLVSADEYNGWKTYHVYCYRCHGVEAMGSDIAPNLRESLRTHITHDLFIETVTNGRLDKGMPAWKELLTKDKMEEVYAYLKARSEGRLKPGRPHTAPKE
jgi:mono/diheme cytochrome c family protein